MFRHWNALILCAGLAAAAPIAPPALAQVGPAQGNDNPTLAFNLGSTADYVPGMQHLDIAKMMRGWIGHKPGQWGGMSYEELREGGYLDAQGWVRRIPNGITKVGTIWQWSNTAEFGHHRKGIYDLTYEGRGTLNVSGDVRILERHPGRLVFESRQGKNIYLDLTETDPNRTGDYIRNIQIIPRKHAELFALGARFNPDWTRLIADARAIRFMDWNGTNNSNIRTWQERGVPGGLFHKRGQPVEYMVQLANEIGADPWFTMPHLANDGYVRNFATYVRDHLDPALTARVEYSNETWNTAFEQARWINAEAERRWNTWSDARHDYHTMKASRVAVIWNEVFGAEAKARLRHVIGSQAANPWATGERLAAKRWRRQDRRGFIPPGELFDELAVTHYFGAAAVGDAEMRADLIAAIKDPRVDAEAYLAARLMDPAYKQSIPDKGRVLAEQAALAAEHGLGLVAYEGGQHVHHSFAVRGLSKEDVALLTEFMTGFVRSEAMARLYRASWDSWTAVSDGPFMQFSDLGPASRWGSWGLRASLDDDTPRARKLTALNARTAPWWDGARGGAHYQHGVIRRGGDGTDRLSGTPQEDYLIGGAGDDVFWPGPGRDGVHGGDGTDLVIFGQVRAAYEIRETEQGVEITPKAAAERAARNLLIGVEQVQFADTGPLPLASPLREAAPRRTQPEQGGGDR